MAQIHALGAAKCTDEQAVGRQRTADVQQESRALACRAAADLHGRPRESSHAPCHRLSLPYSALWRSQWGRATVKGRMPAPGAPRWAASGAATARAWRAWPSWPTRSSSGGAPQSASCMPVCTRTLHATRCVDHTAHHHLLYTARCLRDTGTGQALAVKSASALDCLGIWLPVAPPQTLSAGGCRPG